jgi:hypothetical protein|tara:strand:+ start:4820 stop:5080 length:261 start_codon:yes stop_codon:yes gene_type:complete
LVVFLAFVFLLVVFLAFVFLLVVRLFARFFGARFFGAAFFLRFFVVFLAAALFFLFAILINQLLVTKLQQFPTTVIFSSQKFKKKS